MKQRLDISEKFEESNAPFTRGRIGYDARVHRLLDTPIHKARVRNRAVAWAVVRRVVN